LLLTIIPIERGYKLHEEMADYGASPAPVLADLPATPPAPS